MLQRISKYFSNSTKLALLNAILIGVLIALNTYFQAFCIPTNWTIVLLVICFTNTIIYPLVKNNKKLHLLTSFINGITLFVFIYCVIFLEHMNLTGLLLLIAAGSGVVVFIPHFFIVQLLWRNLIRPTSTLSRKYFLTAILICTGIVFYIGHQYKEAITSIESFEQSNFKELDKSFMTEKILGMHFIYHTRYCFFDGWRPPKHEPILVIGMWLNNRYDPLSVDLKTRLELYKKFFPNRKYKFSCSCAIEYSNVYHSSYFWK